MSAAKHDDQWTSVKRGVRRHFAADAMVALIRTGVRWTAEELAESAYAIADAMMRRDHDTRWEDRPRSTT